MKSSCFTTLGVSFVALAASAGPLDPPAGPISPTYKTLTQVEPRTPISQATTPGTADSTFHITQPGSYYLTDNVAGQASHHAIKIEASNVTVDLNGYTLAGAASGAAVSGVFCPSGNNITVTNGTATGWKGAGIALFSATGVRVTSITASGNAGDGIELGNNSRADDCITNSNGSTGVYASQNCLVTDCVANGNTTNGLYLSNDSKAVRCNASTNVGNGFSCADNAVFTECVAGSNGDCGFKVPWGCTVSRCESLTNTNHGIAVGSYCNVEDNSTRANGAAGIYSAAVNLRNSVRNNTCIENAWGIKLDAGATIVIGNTCSANSNANFTIVANNRVGTIVILPLNAAINGNSGGGSAGNTDPSCNFAY